jgi:uncharacterized protein YndB with AHSA1/START domain
MMASKGWLEGKEIVRFERVLPGPLDRVWDYLTNPRHLAVWFGGEGMEFAIEPRVGGRVHLMGGVFHGEVKDWRPPATLAYSWNLAGVPAPETLVTFDLAEEGGAARLALSQGPIAAGFQAATFSGWHTFPGQAGSHAARRGAGRCDGSHAAAPAGLSGRLSRGSRTRVTAVRHAADVPRLDQRDRHLRTEWLRR